MPTSPIAGLRDPAVGDILRLDPTHLRQCQLKELLDLMRRCGLSTTGIEDAAAAVTRLIERAAITSP